MSEKIGGLDEQIGEFSEFLFSDRKYHCASWSGVSRLSLNRVSKSVHFLRYKPLVLGLPKKGRIRHPGWI